MEKPAEFEAAKQALEGKRVAVRLDEAVEVTELESLRGYFHGVVLPAIAIGAGYSNTKAELAMAKAGLKRRFLTDPATGDVLSTESLSPARYAAFIDDCIRFGAETFGVVVNDPQ